MSDDLVNLSDNDFSITSEVFFSDSNIDRKSVLSQYQVLADLKIKAMYLVSVHSNDPNYWPRDLLRDLMIAVKNDSMALNGRSLKLYNQLWNKNTINSRSKNKKEEKLEYE